MTSIIVKNNVTLTNKVVNTKMQKIKKEYRLALLLERHLYNEIRSIEAVLKKNYQLLGILSSVFIGRLVC